MSFGPTTTLPSTTGQSVRISLGGMLLCIFACTLGLFRVSHDKTGNETAEVRRAFETSLQTYGHPAEVREHDVVLQESDASYNSPTDAIGMRKSGLPKIGLRRPNESDSSAESSSFDAGRGNFLLLLNELNRFCEVSPVEQYSGELAFDFLSLEMDSESHLVTEATDTVRLIKAESPATAWDFEVIVWSQASGEDSRSAAILKASRIRDALSVNAAASGSSISCSGRAWLLKDELSPVLTLVARRKLSSSLSVQNGLQP